MNYHTRDQNQWTWLQLRAMVLFGRGISVANGKAAWATSRRGSAQRCWLEAPSITHALLFDKLSSSSHFIFPGKEGDCHSTLPTAYCVCALSTVLGKTEH